MGRGDLGAGDEAEVLEGWGAWSGRARSPPPPAYHPSAFSIWLFIYTLSSKPVSKMLS